MSFACGRPVGHLAWTQLVGRLDLSMLRAGTAEDCIPATLDYRAAKSWQLRTTGMRIPGTTKLPGTTWTFSPASRATPGTDLALRPQGAHNPQTVAILHTRPAHLPGGPNVSGCKKNQINFSPWSGLSPHTVAGGPTAAWYLCGRFCVPRAHGKGSCGF